jgi:hypothetical protein
MERSLEIFFGVMRSVYEEDGTFMNVVVEERCVERSIEMPSK